MKLLANVVFFNGEGQKPSRLFIVSAMVHKGKEIPDTGRVDILYTPDQVREFLAEYQENMKRESKESLKQGLRDLEAMTFTEVPALHLTGQHAQDVSLIFATALGQIKLNLSTDHPKYKRLN